MNFLENIELSDLNEISDFKSLTQINPLQLAYIGDAIYEVYIRNYLIKNTELNVNKLHKEAIKYVKADAQSDIINFLKDFLKEEEWKIVKRGRNQKSKTSPKNTDISNYRYATGFEALIGYLFLKRDYIRLNNIIEKSVIFINERELRLSESKA